MTIIKSPFVRTEAADCNRRLTVFSRSCFQNGVIEVILFDLIRIVTVEIRFFRIERLFRIERCNRTRAAGIFPFSFRGQSVPVCTSIPAHAFLCHGVNRSQSNIETFGIGKIDCIQPGDVFNRELFSGESSRIYTHQAFIFFLSRFKSINIEGQNSHFVLHFIIDTPVFRFRTSHQETTAGNIEKAVGLVTFLR